MMDPELLAELEQYLKQVSTAIHEGSHLAAALSCGLAVRFSEAKPDDKSRGRTDLTGFYENGKLAGVGDLLFVLYAGVEADSFFNLDPGHATDEKIVDGLVSSLQEIAEPLKAFSRSSARDFLVKQKDAVFKLAEALMTQRLTGDEAKAVSAKAEISSVFMDAVNWLSISTWNPPK